MLHEGLLENIRIFQAPVFSCAASYTYYSEYYILPPINWSVFNETPSFEHLNKVGVRAAMDSNLEEQRSIIKFLLLDGEKPCHIF